MLLLAGDVGGTKTTLAVVSPEVGPRIPLAEATFSNSCYPNFEAVAREFLNRANVKVDQASFGVAGPVVGSRAQITNLPWVLDEAELRDALNLESVHLLNDSEAIAHAVPILKTNELHTLHAGRPEARGAKAVIAPGTGLGEAFLVWDGVRYRAYASEGGHTDFAPTNELELDLLQYLLQRYEHVSYERVCSGIGIPNIFQYLRDRKHAEEPAWLTEQLMAAKDPTPVIVRVALDENRSCEICVTTMNIFVSILGAAAGNLALKVLATGGVYLGGGILPRMLPTLRRGERFMQSFKSKGRRTDLMALMPVHVILHPNSALLGAAVHSLEALGAA